MTTGPDKNQQTDEKPGLTERQRSFIPLLVTSSTFTEACERGRINRTTLYEWLKLPGFKAEVERQREQIVQESFAILSQGLTKAVEALLVMLDDTDKRLKRLAAKDVIDYFIRHKELNELAKRIEAIEQKLA
jgi:Cdc6-like AAA superfamily ATPase